MGRLLDSNQFAQIRKNLKESVQKETSPEPLKPFKEHVEPERKKDIDPSRITRDGISSMYESIKTVKEKYPEDPTLILGEEFKGQSTDHYASAIRDHSSHIQKQTPIKEAGLFDGDPMDAPVSKKDFFKILNTSLSSIGGGGVGMNDVTDYVDDKIQTAFDVDFGNTFVNVTGDSMSGGLFVNMPANKLDTALRINTRSGATIKIGSQDARYPMDLHMPTNTQAAWGATVRIATDFKVKKDGNNIDGSNLLDVQRENSALVLDGTVKTKKLEHFSGTNTLIEQTSGIYQNVSHKFTGSNYNSMMHRTLYNGTPYIDYSIGGSNTTMDKDAEHPHVAKKWRFGVQYQETKIGTIPGESGSYIFVLREVFDEREGGTGGVQRIRELRDPVYTTDAVNYRSMNSRSSRLQPSYIGDSVQRAIIESGLSTPLDSSDSTGGVGTLFVNTSGARPRLQFWKDSEWQDLRSKFDSDETVGLINSLRYTTANHDSDTLAQVDSDYVRSRVRTDQDLRTTDDVTFQHIHMTHASGALSFAIKNETGGTVTKGTVVFINGISGDVPTIGLADADGVGTMPAYGLVEADANNNAETHVLTFGTLTGIDTSAFAVGDTLYVSTTPGVLTNVPPAGSSASLQNIGRVIRSHATAGSIKVGGAGRSNATPNLDAGHIFYGSDSNRSVATELTTIVDSNYVQTRIDASQLDFSGVPTSDPLTAGLVWRDSDNGNVLKVSVG